MFVNKDFFLRTYELQIVNNVIILRSTQIFFRRHKKYLEIEENFPYILTH